MAHIINCCTREYDEEPKKHSSKICVTVADTEMVIPPIIGPVNYTFIGVSSSALD